MVELQSYLRFQKGGVTTHDFYQPTELKKKISRHFIHIFPGTLRVETEPIRPKDPTSNQKVTCSISNGEIKIVFDTTKLEIISIIPKREKITIHGILKIIDNICRVLLETGSEISPYRHARDIVMDEKGCGSILLETVSGNFKRLYIDLRKRPEISKTEEVSDKDIKKHDELQGQLTIKGIYIYEEGRQLSITSLNLINRLVDGLPKKTKEDLKKDPLKIRFTLAEIPWRSLAGGVEAVVGGQLGDEKWQNYTKFQSQQF